MNDNPRFEWDDAKAASNFAKHRIMFEIAARVFSDASRIDVDASRLSDGEARRKTVGIISVRRSNTKERRIHASIYA